MDDSHTVAGLAAPMSESSRRQCSSAASRFLRNIEGVIGTLGGHLVASVDDIELLLHQAVGGKLNSL